MSGHTLRPCPFCGLGELETYRLGAIYFVQCQSCDIERTGRSEAEAIAAWNERPIERELLGALEAADRRLCELTGPQSEDEETRVVVMWIRAAILKAQVQP